MNTRKYEKYTPEEIVTNTRKYKKYTPDEVDRLLSVSRRFHSYYSRRWK